MLPGGCFFENFDEFRTNFVKKKVYARLIKKTPKHLKKKVTFRRFPFDFLAKNGGVGAGAKNTVSLKF